MEFNNFYLTFIPDKSKKIIEINGINKAQKQSFYFNSRNLLYSISFLSKVITPFR